MLGLLGPNGAGKTTAVRTLATLLALEQGEARVAGADVRTQPDDVRRRIGLSGQTPAVDEILGGRQNLVLFARLGRLAGLPPTDAPTSCSSSSSSPRPPTDRSSTTPAACVDGSTSP